jgi:hypothetical protein
MASIKAEYAASAAISITLNSLANSATAGRESAAVDNSSNKYLDALVRVEVTLAAGSPANDKTVYVYAYGSEDGTNYTDNATGSDAALTQRVPSNLRLIGAIATPDSGGLLYKSNPMSVAAAFGGILPRKWGIVVRNYSGLALHTSGHAASYTGVYATSA